MSCKFVIYTNQIFLKIMINLLICIHKFIVGVYIFLDTCIVWLYLKQYMYNFINKILNAI